MDEAKKAELLQEIVDLMLEAGMGRAAYSQMAQLILDLVSDSLADA